MYTCVLLFVHNMYVCAYLLSYSIVHNNYKYIIILYVHTYCMYVCVGYKLPSDLDNIICAQGHRTYEYHPARRWIIIGL